MEERLVDKLLDFDRTRVRREECVITWKAIADELGVSEDTIQRWCDANHLQLPRWGPPGRRSPVFLPRGKIMILKSLYFSAAMG